MSNFCRITGSTRGLPKTNHFFPILPPISPAEAKKYKNPACRITSNYNPNHNYIPIKSYLDVTHVSKCTITRNSLFKYKHFQFIVPKMNSKSANQYFYMLDSKVLLIPDEIEMQLARGIITDIQISNHTIGFKYNYKVKEYDLEVLSELMEDNLLFKTCKYTDDIHPGKGLKCVKKRNVGKRKGSIAALTQLFSDKEKKAEMDVLKSEEKIRPDHGKIAKVKGKLDERRKSVQIAPDASMEEDLAPPPLKYLLHSGEVVEEINKENAPTVKASVQGHTVVGGKVIDGLFTPGMVAKGATDKFIPGVMVDSHFTPGQMLEVSPGNKKFIPGQVIEIQGANKFVPGQLILEDDTGTFKFVPGRVEQGEFYPGEIVETQEGLKFVCEMFDANEFELQTFELENPVLFEVEDVKTLMETANVVPIEFNECCEVIFEQAVFEKRVDERVINNAKEKLKERAIEDLLEAIEFARLLGKHAIASELEGVLQADEETRSAVLSDSSVKLLLTQLVVLKGIIGGRVAEVGEEELGKAIYKSNVVAKVLVDEGVIRGSVENSHSNGSLDRNSDGTGVPSSGTVEAEELREESADPMDRTVIKQTFSSRSVETHDGAVIEFQSHHAVTEYRSSTTAAGEMLQEASALSATKRQRLGQQKPASLDLDSIPPESVELLDTTPAKHKLSLARQMRHKSGSSVSSVGSEKKSKIILKSGEEMLADSTLTFKNERDLILYELLETEEEFVRELEFVMGCYYKEIETSVLFNKYRDLLFEDFKLIYQFHSTSLLEAIRYYSDDPKMIAKSFLRLERDFEPHVRYYQDHIKIEEVISNDLDLLEFIEDLSVSKRISDTKSLADHLKLPLQRINDYVLIFKDLLDVCARIHDDEHERDVLSRVLEFLVAIPQKLDDRKFLNSIEGIDAGVLGKLGRLLGHDWFVVTEKASPSSSEGSKNRYVFLFKQKLLITKVRRISDHRSVFILKQALHLPEYEVEQIGKGFRLWKEAREILFEASEKESGVQSWVAEISKYTKREGAEILDVNKIVILDAASSKSETSEDETIAAKGVSIVEIQDSDAFVEQFSNENVQVSKATESEKVVDTPTNKQISTDPSSAEPEKIAAKPAADKSEPHQAPKEQEKVAEPQKKGSVKKSEEQEKGKPTPEPKKGSVKKPEEKAKAENPTESQDTPKKGSKDEEPQKPVSRQNSSSEAKKPVDSKPPTGSQRVDRQKSEQEKAKMADDEGAPNPAQLLRRRSSVIMAKPAVESSLKFVEPIQSIECEPGENASFRLKVSSPSTIITWLKGNRPLEDKLADRVKIESKGAVHSLTILNVNDNDGGLYTAKVCELVGKDGDISEPVSCSAVLVVHELTPEERAQKIAERDSPQFLVKFKDTELLKHTTVNFMFLIKGNPEPEVVFKRNDKVLASEGRVSISPHGVGKYEMKIEKIEDSDQGTYTVVAKNKHGVSEVNAVVKVVDEKDVFNEGTAIKPDGEGAERKGLLKPGEEPIFTWFKDGKTFEPGETSKSSSRTRRTRLRSCSNTSSRKMLGRISCSAELTVQGGINQLLKEPSAPSITAKLTDTEVSLGGSAMLELKVTGFPKPDISWFKDKTLLEAGGRFRFLYEDDESIALIIKNVNYQDEGLYKVIAKNDLGEATTSGNLVIRQPPKFMKKMTDTEMMAGESFNMEVEVEGNPKPELKWYKDGQLIVSSERIKFTQSKDGQKYIMSIERVTLDDTGAYSVVASNAVGQMSEFWNVLATMPARFTERLPGNVVCDKGDKGFEYVVKTAGVPDPKLEVKLCGKELKYEKLDHQVYKIKVGDITELKDYDLVASATNQFAKDETVCIFNVNRPVKIVDGLKEVIVKEHGEATVGVKVDCYPKPKSVKWFIDGVEIGGKAYDTKEEAGGVYKLIVKDAYKDTGCRYDVKGLSAVSRLEFNTVQELNVTLKETTPTPKGIWYHNGQEVTADARIKISKKSTETYTLTFDCVKYEDAGEWSFKAVNDIGEVSTKTTVIVEGKPQITSPLPNSMRILETETYDLSVNILDYCEENVKIEWKSNVDTTFKPIIACKKDGNEYHSSVTFVPNRKENYFKVVATNKYGETESLCQIDWIALVPPKILTPMKDSYTIQDGDAFKFESEVEGVPKPKLVWLYNGEVINEQVNAVEGVVQKGTVGEYTLQAVNVAGEAISKTKLNLLQTNPTLSNLSENYAFKEQEDDLVLSVDITGSPIPTVTWLHNGQPIDLNDPRVSVTTTPTKSTLVVKNAAKADKGAYSAQVSNQNGTAEGKANVAITFVPEIDGKITYPDLVTKNTRFELKATVKGEPFPEVEWVHPTGKTIKETEAGVHELKVYPDGSVILAIESAQMTDGGVYKLGRGVRQELTRRNRRANRNRQPARTRPRINPPLPPQIKLIEGHPLTLRTTVKAHPIPELALKFEDATLPYEQRTIENGLEFEHKCEKVATSGTFSLKATNSEGATESECRLIVIPRLKEGALKAPEFANELLDKVVNEGDELLIIAKVDGNPIPEVEIIVNGKQIDVRDILEFDGNNLKYRIPDTRMGDAGEYKIVLKSSEGQAESKCNVKVNKVFKAPEFLQKFTDQAQVPTRDCKFGAKVSGFPIPSVKWLKDGNEIDTSRSDKYKLKHEDETVLLQVRNCDDSDIGAAGCPRTEAPYFLKTIGSTEVYPGMQSKFTACVGGNPEPDFEWFKDGNRMHEAQGSRIQFVRDGIGAGLIKLIINDTNIGDIGEYKLRIFNDLGQASCAALLKFDTPGAVPLGRLLHWYSDLRPTALPDRPVITRMDEGSVTLSWKSAIPNVHSQHPCTYTLEISPADGNDWKPVYTGLQNNYADVAFPSPSLDYKFRVRVQWGERYVSEPSPYVITNSTRTPPVPEQRAETQYGIRNTPASVQFAVYGYPKPTLSFRFNGAPVTLNHTYTDNGIVTIYLNEMNEQKIGCYECIATNSHGISTQPIELRLTDIPRFLEHLKETHVCARKNGRIHCVVTGIPCPTIRLYKDWNATPRPFQQVQIDENTVSVTVLFEDTLLRDEGMYSIVATNHAGSTHSSALVRIHEDETSYNWNSYGVRPRVLRLRKTDPDEFYHFGNLIGRGTQGTHYHVVETRTGTAWAAKRMLIDESNSLHRHMIETEIENWACVNSPHVVRLYDGFFDNRTFTLINELCTGGDLFGYLIYELEDFDENTVKGFVEQILKGVRDLHETKLWHCSLQPLDILLTHKKSRYIKLTDLGVSRFNDPQPNRYSHPEFASPELISQSGINWKTDMWSVGVIAYILLTGHHPYVGLNDQETMENLKNWNGQINETHLSRLSSNAIDFLRCLLRITANERPSACEALEHAWFRTSESRMVNLFNESHVKYYTHLRAWQSNADSIDRFRRNPLEVAYKHVSKMVYPPGYDWVEEREVRVITKSDYSFPRPYVEIDDFVSESHYQSGDDTYLLQLRDTDFPARLRQYMKVAANASPRSRSTSRTATSTGTSLPPERRARGLRHEVGSRMDIQAEAEAIISMKREGREPCFRERPRSISYAEAYDQDLSLNVVVDGDPGAPDVQWFRGDTLLVADDPVHRRRLEVTTTVDNTLVRTELLIRKVKNTDLTVYKCTARNKQGQITWKFRVALLPDSLRLPSPNPALSYSLEKTPTPLSTEVHSFESVSTPEVVVKGCFTSVLKSGPRVYKLSTNEEYDIARKLIHTHVLGGEYTQAIQIGSGVACSYNTSVVGLLDHLVGLGSYTEQTVVSVVEQILHGLSYLHWCGVAGVGLGACSYGVDKQGVVKILDLSAAQKINKIGVASEAIGKRTNVQANLEFISPEALSSTDTQVCPQSDIWSVGVLIYVLLSGASPFRGENEDETKQNILFVRFRFEHLYKDLSQEVTRLIMLIFKRSPMKRPSAEECFEHRWFHPTESLTKKRQKVVFPVDKLQAYAESVALDEELSSTAAESNGVLQAFYTAHHL
ncbi:Muscle M-line assembly protein unc-89 [Orchesella cincta]|uniref:Muscle M-line assembly protein unc-89 n=1 Tax=Orchesella cincta TaxID=48709 RepID=A0A1D2MQ78_ORCCI|nr:Muscle M-line assembly protein unc-89 [Orchesella cincta]